MLKYTDSTKGLKKSSEGYYDKESGLIFTKDKDGLKIIISEYDKKLFNSQMKRLKALQTKYNVSLKSEMNDLEETWNEYKEYVQKFNNRDVKWSNTVSSRYRQFEKVSMKQEKLFGSISLDKKAKQNFLSLVENKKKVMVLRMNGHKGVYDENANMVYNDFINSFTSKLGLSFSEVESIMFPNGIEESSKYEDVIELIDEGYYNLQDVIDDRVSEGAISEYDAVALENILDSGLGAMFE